MTARRKAVIRPIKPLPTTPIDIDLPPTITLSNTERLDDRMVSRIEGRCQEAQIALGRGDLEAARHALRSALELHDLADNVWLFLAGVAATAAEQRDALENALACNPHNQIAVEALLRLDGRLENVDQVSSQRLEVGQVTARRIVCPHCGGNLGYDTGERVVSCRFCGQRILDADEMFRSGAQTPLQVALLKRKQQKQVWQIGGRWLRCGECGATTTLSRNTLTNTCRFCDSRQVIQENVNHRFEQPDFIIPFAVDEGQARAAIQAKLKSGIRMITHLFADAVERIDLYGVYLPFWVFDAEMNVAWSWSNAPDHGNYPILLGDVLHFAAETPSAYLLRQIEPYDLLRGVDYDPRLLAVHPAELYQTDVDRASLDVRGRLKKLAERRVRPLVQARRPRHGYGSGWGGSDSHSDPGRLLLNTNTRYMSYRFGLLPVWIARLIEADGDVRQVIVNGQTGTAALGELVKRTR